LYYEKYDVFENKEFSEKLCCEKSPKNLNFLIFAPKMVIIAFLDSNVTFGAKFQFVLVLLAFDFLFQGFSTCTCHWK